MPPEHESRDPVRAYPRQSPPRGNSGRPGPTRPAGAVGSGWIRQVGSGTDSDSRTSTWSLTFSPPIIAE